MTCRGLSRVQRIGFAPGGVISSCRRDLWGSGGSRRRGVRTDAGGERTLQPRQRAGRGGGGVTATVHWAKEAFARGEIAIFVAIALLALAACSQQAADAAYKACRMKEELAKDEVDFQKLIDYSVSIIIVDEIHSRDEESFLLAE